MSRSGNRSAISKKPSKYITDASVSTLKTVSQKSISVEEPYIDYQAEIVLLFYNSMLNHIVEECSQINDDNKPYEDDESDATVSKDFRDLCLDDMKSSKISNVVGSQVSLTKKRHKRSPSTDSKSSKTKRKSKGSANSLRKKGSKKGAEKVKHQGTTSKLADLSTTSISESVESSSFKLDKMYSWMVSSEEEDVYIKYKNGNTYKGSIYRKRFHGSGIFTWWDGVIYKGEFKNGHVTGKGRITFSDNSYYIGNVCKGLLHGEGCMYALGTYMLYNGEWRAGKKNGKGWILYAPNNWYNGEWYEDMRHGVGLRQYDKHSRYKGGWHQGQRSGQGSMVWNNSDYYNGEWLKGLMSGYGKYIWKASVNKTFTFRITNNYEGHWHNGMRNGTGLMHFGFNGDARLAGSWVNNMKHGAGVIVCGNGKTIQRHPLFLYDKPILLNSWSSLLSSSMGDYSKPSTSLVSTQSPSKQSGSKESSKQLSIEESLQRSNLSAESINFTKVLSKQMNPLCIPVHSQPEQVDLTFHLQNVLEKYGIYVGGSCEMCACENNSEMYLKLKEVMNFEEKKLRFAITDNYLLLQSIYYQYAAIATSEQLTFKPVLVRLFLWQLYLDIDVCGKELSIYETDLILNRNPACGLDTDHDPFERIHIWQFLLSLIGVAWEIYSKSAQPLGGDGILAHVFLKLLFRDIVPNSGKLKGFALCEYKNLLPINSVYAMYKNLGEPHTTRTFLKACLKNVTPPCYEKLFDDEKISHIPRSSNVTSIGDGVVFLQDEIKYGQRPDDLEPYPFPDDTVKNNLHMFQRMTSKKMIKCIGKICSRVIDENVVVNMDYNLSFLEFYNIVLSCAYTIINDAKRREEKLRKMKERNMSFTFDSIPESRGRDLSAKGSRISKKGSVKDKKSKK